jgi:hypothetical protein
MVDDQPILKGSTRKGVESGDGEAAPDPDLSQEIERVIDRQPLDHVKCVRVFGNFYRCNWWSRAGGRRMGMDYEWAGLIMDCVRESRFLSATMQSGELVIKQVGPAPARNENQARDTIVQK